MRVAALILLPLWLAAAPAIARALPEEAAITAGSDALRYPAARRLNLVEDHFGVQVADPYRWLENDLRADPGEQSNLIAERADAARPLSAIVDQVVAARADVQAPEAQVDPRTVEALEALGYLE